MTGYLLLDKRADRESVLVTTESGPRTGQLRRQVTVILMRSL